MDSIPTCEDQEDHIAMSTVAARRCRQVLQNAQQVIAIELLSAAHALDLRKKSQPNQNLGTGTAQALHNVKACLSTCEPHATIGDQIEQAAGGHLQPLTLQWVARPQTGWTISRLPSTAQI